MASGLPVVASDIPGNRELVVEGETGFLFNPGDDQTLAHILEQLAIDSRVGERLGRAGRAALIEKGLSSGESAKRHIDLYRSLLANQGVPFRPTRS
jgi:glycosyltransferase involved in cell wall biosynthesis